MPGLRNALVAAAVIGPLMWAATNLLNAESADLPQPYTDGLQAYTPQFDPEGNLIRPVGWRDWPYLGTPLTPNALNAPAAAFPEFHSVYIEPAAWAHFKKTGDFRDGTIIVKELTRVQIDDTTDPANGSKAETSGQGYFMGEYSGLEATVKNAARFGDQPGGWAYFTFGHVPEAEYAARAAAQPSENCSACHSASAGRDNVFIQHYPVLRSALTRATGN